MDRPCSRNSKDPESKRYTLCPPKWTVVRNSQPRGSWIAIGSLNGALENSFPNGFVSTGVEVRSGRLRVLTVG